jgi:hypothetical protein
MKNCVRQFDRDPIVITLLWGGVASADVHVHARLVMTSPIQPLYVLAHALIAAVAV